MKAISALALFLFLLLIPSVHAITIQQGVSFNATGANTTYIAGANFTVDKITVTSTFLNMTNSSGDFIMSATPSSGSLNITILGFNASYKGFNISSNVSGITVNFVIGNITPVSALMVFLKNGAYWNTFTSNLSGYISFTYSEGYSNIQFEALQDTTAPTVSLSVSSSSIYQTQAITISCSASDNYQVSSTSLIVTKPGGYLASASCNQPFTDTSASGTYAVAYSATDSTGNSASASQTFAVNQLQQGGSSKSSAAESKTQITATSSEAVEKIVVNLNVQMQGASVMIAKMESVPQNVPSPFSSTETAYQYFNITKNNFNNSQIKNVTIDFKVNKSWIIENNITNVSLARYENGWKKLKTELINQTTLMNYYRAYTNAFSYFAIVGEKATAILPNNNTENIMQANITAESGAAANETQTGSQNQYGNVQIYAAIAVILVAAVAFRKRIARMAPRFLSADRKILKEQKKRFEALKDGLPKEDKDKIKQYLDQGCAHLAKAGMDEMEKKGIK